MPLRDRLDLVERSRAAAFLRLVADELIEVRARFDGDETARHVGVARPAELSAVDLVFSQSGRLKPNRNLHSRDGVLTNAQRDHLKGVDDIQRTDMNDHALVDRHVHLVELREIVRGARRLWIDAELVAVADQFWVLFAEDLVGSGVANIPTELLSHDAHDRRFAFGRKRVHT